jgi:hypothetical protein
MAQADPQEAQPVIVIRESEAVRGVVKDLTTANPVVVDETGRRVQWEVFAIAESLPLVFETREKALDWARNDACAKYFDLGFLTNPRVSDPGGSESVKRGKS